MREGDKSRLKRLEVQPMGCQRGWRGAPAREAGRLRPAPASQGRACRGPREESQPGEAGPHQGGNSGDPEDANGVGERGEDLPGLLVYAAGWASRPAPADAA